MRKHTKMKLCMPYRAFSWVEDRNSKPFIIDTSDFSEYFLACMSLNVVENRLNACEEQNILEYSSLLCSYLALWEKELITCSRSNMK